MYPYMGYSGPESESSKKDEKTVKRTYKYSPEIRTKALDNWTLLHNKQEACKRGEGVGLTEEEVSWKALWREVLDEVV